MYAAVIEDEWHRVEVREVLDKDKADSKADAPSVLCFNIDNGELETLSAACLKELHESFRAMPAQAVAFRLRGLEAVKDSAKVKSELENNLLGKSLNGRPHRDASGTLAMTLIDVATDEDVDVNKLILDRLVAAGEAVRPAPTPKAEETAPKKEASAAKSTSPTPAAASASNANSSFLPEDLAMLKELVPPQLPDLEDFFDVNIASAASPSNFTVQPWESSPELDDHQLAMNEFYNAAVSASSVSASDLESDRFFAARHSDGVWYRVCVKGYVDPGQLSVRFVDYGECALMAMAEMRPLASQFRNLPMQAVNAALAGEQSHPEN